MAVPVMLAPPVAAVVMLVPSAKISLLPAPVILMLLFRTAAKRILPAFRGPSLSRAFFRKRHRRMTAHHDQG